MGLILKIAAGVIIGLLLFQFVLFQQPHVDNTSQNGEAQRAQDLLTSYTLLTNSINSYYRRNKTLPDFISDLKCTDRFNNSQIMACASVVSDGIFYANHDNDWISVEPYTLDKHIFYKCRTSISLATLGENFSNCLELDVTSIPEKITPEFDCNTTTNEIERIICSSDRLIASDVKLSSIYNNMLSRSSEDKKQEIKQDKTKFNEQRNQKCHTSECIKTMTEAKITRLEFLGTMNPAIK